MFRNNLKIAWRSLLKDRQFTILNLVGLAAGLACTLLIFLWVRDEMSFDKFNERDSQLYQLMELRNPSGKTSLSDESSGMLAESLAARMSDIQYYAAVAPPDWFQKFTLSVGDKKLKATGQYVGKDYFNIFSFKLLDGKPDGVLRDKNSIVISEDLARKLFGTAENVIGKPVRFQQDQNFFVSGVFERLPYHSSQQFDFVLSFEYYKDIMPWVKSWGNTGPHNFVILKKGTDIKEFNKRISKVIAENCGDTTRVAFAMPFSDNYLHNTFSHGSRLGGRMEYVRLFSIIAIFILVIACINFMNLSTAKASRRLKEVGIKKVVGVGRRELIFQFLGESILLTFFAALLALVLVLMLLPEFNSLTGKEISLGLDPGILFGVIGITLVTGILAGSYPALYLSGFNPISVLKGKIKSSIGEVWARKGLVVFQFTLSVMLIVAVLIVYKQIQFIQSTNLGYNKENIIRFYAEGTILNSEESFLAGLKKIPGVVNASNTFHAMIGRNYGTNGISWEGKDPREQVYFEGLGCGYDFIQTMGMQMAAGRGFSKDFGADSNKIIFNEAAIKAMGIKDPVGKFVDQNIQIIGVVKDFHFESLHEPVKPLFMSLETQGSSWDKIMVRIAGENQKATIDRIEQYYTSRNPGFPFDFNFLDEAYQKQYLSEMRVSVLSRYFAGLAILISCLGLFGLAAFTAQRRRKEIGIRKVVGASVGDIIGMLSQDFLKLILISVFIAFPLSWWAMDRWLHSFAYRTDIGVLVFLIAGGSILLVTLLTISFQALKAAVANPVGALRSE
jgi:putative ABC transport system permease protein